MFAIQAKGVGKKFNRNWLFKDVELDFAPLHAYALTGFNGSGKSTLLQMMYGYQVPTSGTITGKMGDHRVPSEHFYKHVAFVAPYIELPEELSLTEALQFHFSFKARLNSITDAVMIEEAGLKGNEDKQIRYFSSGMKQRLKLMLAFNTECEVMMLDEPCSNLDEWGIEWYRSMMLRLKGKRLILIASNQKAEYDFCDKIYAVTDFKPLPVK